MKYSKLSLENGTVVETESKTIDQNKLTGECWLIQFKGLEACKTCELKGKRDCGGKKIRKTLKNNKGFSVKKGGL